MKALEAIVWVAAFHTQREFLQVIGEQIPVRQALHQQATDLVNRAECQTLPLSQRALAYENAQGVIAELKAMGAETDRLHREGIALVEICVELQDRWGMPTEGYRQTLNMAKSLVPKPQPSELN